MGWGKPSPHTERELACPPLRVGTTYMYHNNIILEELTPKLSKLSASMHELVSPPCHVKRRGHVSLPHATHIAERLCNKVQFFNLCLHFFLHFAYTFVHCKRVHESTKVLPQSSPPTPEICPPHPTMKKNLNINQILATTPTFANRTHCFDLPHSTRTQTMGVLFDTAARYSALQIPYTCTSNDTCATLVKNIIYWACPLMPLLTAANVHTSGKSLHQPTWMQHLLATYATFDLFLHVATGRRRVA